MARKATAAKAAPARDTDRDDKLKALIDEIETRKMGDFDALAERLKAEEGLEVVADEVRTVIAMQGIEAEATSQPGLFMALTNWAMAARRAVYW